MKYIRKIIIVRYAFGLGGGCCVLPFMCVCVCVWSDPKKKSLAVFDHSGADKSQQILRQLQTSVPEPPVGVSATWLHSMTT